MTAHASCLSEWCMTAMLWCVIHSAYLHSVSFRRAVAFLIDAIKTQPDPSLESEEQPDIPEVAIPGVDVI